MKEITGLLLRKCGTPICCEEHYKRNMWFTGTTALWLNQTNLLAATSLLLPSDVTCVNAKSKSKSLQLTPPENKTILPPNLYIAHNYCILSDYAT
jgi:hypothetical protein